MLFVDSSLVVVDKPVGIAAEAALRLLRAQLPGYLEAVHRIDQPVTGLLILARTKEAAATLNAQLAARTLVRRYLAVCEQVPRSAATELSHRLRFDTRINKVIIDGDRGSPAVLKFRVIGTTERYPVVLVELETGRRHQIRAQLSAVGAPVVGDLKYGARRSRRGGGICLHAVELSFVHPTTGATMTVHAPVAPADPLMHAAYLIANEVLSAGDGSIEHSGANAPN